MFDTTVGDDYLACIKVGDESTVSKTTIVIMVLLYVDRLSCCKIFKCFLGFNGISRSKSLVEMYTAKVGGWRSGPQIWWMPCIAVMSGIL